MKLIVLQSIYYELYSISLHLFSEIHEQTLTKLRQELTQINQDEWMYKPIDQIIGFWALLIDMRDKP